MNNKPVFQGLVLDEENQLVEVSYVGSEPCYVVNDLGFRRHIPSEYVDRQVMEKMKEMILGNEDLLVEQAAKMLGQDDIFTKAILLNQFSQIDQKFDDIFTTGIPEEGRAYMGMMGFKIIIDVHGEVIRMEQPGSINPEED